MDGAVKLAIIVAILMVAGSLETLSAQPSSGPRTSVIPGQEVHVSQAGPVDSKILPISQDGVKSASANGLDLPVVASIPRSPLTRSSDFNGQVVDPLACKDAEPAPMGIADYGVNPATDAGYEYNSPDVFGEVDYTSLSTYNASLSTLNVSDYATGFQLNLILYFVSGGVEYSYWVQDVALIDSQSYYVDFLDNIWNMSSPSASMQSSTVQGNGTIASAGSTDFYYDVASSSLPGNGAADPPSGYIYMRMESGLVGGRPAVEFLYADPATDGDLEVFDTPVFGFASTSSSDYGFVVDGNGVTPLGLFYDYEFIQGGPGGGSQTENVDTNESFFLDYWTGHNWDATPSAWNFGCDTAEGVTNTDSQGAYDNTGTLFEVLVDGSSAPYDAPTGSYSEGEVGELNVTDSSITGSSYADIYVNQQNESWIFEDDYGNITLYPGTYHVYLSVNGGSLSSLGSCTISAGKVLDVSSTSGCGGGPGGPAIASFSASPNPVAVDQTTTISASVSGGTTPYSYSYSGLPTTCLSGDEPSISCTPVVTGNYTITLTVTDNTGLTASKTIVLEVENTVTDTGPTISGFSATVNPVGEGNSTVLEVTATGGVTPYTYSYSGLPGGCSSFNTASLSCTPTSSGNFNITVTVTDHDGKTASMSLQLEVKASGQNNNNGGGSTYPFGLSFLDLVLIVVLVLGIICIVAVAATRKGEPETAPAPPPPAQPGYGGYAPAPPPPPPPAYLAPPQPYPAAQGPTPPAPPAISHTVTAAFCPECGTKVLGGAAFCENCGRALPH